MIDQKIDPRVLHFLANEGTYWLLEAFVEYLVSPESNTAVDHESLYDISLCEVDCLMLTPTGVQSFDSKVMLTEFQYKSAKPQRSMQQPESLRPTPYYVVCSSNPKKPNSEKNTLHMSQLKIGPALLDKNNSHHWIPNEKLARFIVDLYAKDNDLNINNYNQLQELFCLPLDQIFRVTNLEPSELIEILCPLLKGDEFLQIREMLHQLMSKIYVWVEIWLRITKIMLTLFLYIYLNFLLRYFLF